MQCFLLFLCIERYFSICMRTRSTRVPFFFLGKTSRWNVIPNRVQTMALVSPTSFWRSPSQSLAKLSKSVHILGKSYSFFVTRLGGWFCPLTWELIFIFIAELSFRFSSLSTVRAMLSTNLAVYKKFGPPGVLNCSPISAHVGVRKISLEGRGRNDGKSFLLSTLSFL